MSATEIVGWTALVLLTVFRVAFVVAVVAAIVYVVRGVLAPPVGVGRGGRQRSQVARSRPTSGH